MVRVKSCISVWKMALSDVVHQHGAPHFVFTAIIHCLIPIAIYASFILYNYT